MKSLMIAAVVAVMSLLAQEARAAKVFEMGASTPTLVAVQVCTGSDCSLFDIVASSNVYTAGDALACFSSATVAGYTAAFQEGKTASPKLDSVVITTANTSQGRKGRPEPVAAPNGIVCIKQSIGAIWQVFYGGGS